MEQKYYLLFDHTWAANRGPTERPIRIAFPTRGWIALFIWHHQRTAVPVTWAIVGKLNSSPESKAKFCWLQLLTCQKSMCTYSQNSAWRKHLLRYVFPFVPQTRSVFFVHLCVQLTPFVRTVQWLKSTLVTSRRTKTQSWHMQYDRLMSIDISTKNLLFLQVNFLNSQSFVYITLSEPHTGSASLLHTFGQFKDPHRLPSDTGPSIEAEK